MSIFARGQVSFASIGYGMDKSWIKSRWYQINGSYSLTSTGVKGSYYTTKLLAAQYVALDNNVFFNYNGKAYTFNGKLFTYKLLGVNDLDVIYLHFRDYLKSVGLDDGDDELSNAFSWDTFSEYLVQYEDAEKRVNDNINKALQTQIQQTKNEILSDIQGFESVVNSAIAGLQNVVDNNIETHFYNGVPTLSNAPANSWSSSDYESHLGDVYYDGNTGYAYRFQYNSSTSTYYWNDITDTGIGTALSVAATAQDTADSKRRVYLSQPTQSDVYDIGDLWLNATVSGIWPNGNASNEMLVARQEKASGTAFSSTDWMLATKYTDNTVANQAQTAATNAAAAAAAAQSTADAAQTAASTANTRLNNWMSDGIISPPEKVVLYQEWQQVLAEYPQIVADAQRYNLLNESAYINYYSVYSTVAPNGGVFAKYTAASPENITVASDYSYISQYYSRKATLLQTIAAAAQALATSAKSIADAAMDLIDDINADDVLTLGEKLVIRTTWVRINGSTSLTSVSADGTYSKARAALVNTPSAPVSYVHNGQILVYNEYNYIYKDVRISNLDTAFYALRTFLVNCELNVDDTYYNFDRATYSQLLRNYDVAENALTDTTTSHHALKYDILLDEMAQGIGYTDYASLIAAAQADTTIIDGGYIRTTLIEATALVSDTAFINALKTNILEAGTATFSGQITASSGTIGGFTIGSTSIYNTKSSLQSSTAGVYIGTDGIGLGSTVANGRFYVTSAGKLYCSDAEIEGIIRAGSGRVATWTIDTDKLYSGSGSTYVALNSDSSSTYAIWCGNSAAGSAPFSVTRAGALKSTSGTIGGFEIGTNRLGAQSYIGGETTIVDDGDTGGDIFGRHIVITPTPASSDSMSLYSDHIEFNSSYSSLANRNSSNVYIGKSTTASNSYFPSMLVSVAGSGIFNTTLNGTAVGVEVNVEGFSKNIAFNCGSGEFAGLRPATRYVSPGSSSLSILDHTIIAKPTTASDGAVSLVLPPFPQNGQEYIIVNMWPISGKACKIYGACPARATSPVHPFVFNDNTVSFVPTFSSTNSQTDRKQSTNAFESTTKETLHFIYCSSMTYTISGTTYTGIWVVQRIA